MTYTEQAIQKAIEGGYDYDKQGCPAIKYRSDKGGGFTIWYQDGRVAWHQQSPQDACRSSLLDSLFWQSLGKSLGWTENPAYLKSYKGKDTWWGHWHDFIDHLAEGKDAESFFANLLNK